LDVVESDSLTLFVVASERGRRMERFTLQGEAAGEISLGFHARPMTKIHIT
jgi:hypothetical protein